ncbi:MAG TPA: polysaccharide biosynthesis/export family protein [Bryobacteraceae bacterium]|nr:polysaccharide biosynthesis/export family protein [Bryobacteraceae bacterium]
MTQTLQRLMFNLNGTHKSDAEIAETVPRVIQRMIQDGVMKPENAPKSPIKGFDDANRFLMTYPSDAPQGPSAAPQTAPAVAPESAASAGSAPAATPAPSSDCPKNQPWLCPVAGAAPPVTPSKPSGSNASRAASQPASSSQATPKTASAAPKSSPEDSTGKTAGEDDKTPFYVYGENDVVGVTVAGEPTVSGTVPIMPDGRISMPLIGTFRAAGFTGPQLTDLITQKLRDDGGILEPIVNVQLLRSNSKHYTVMGAVLRPGPVPLIQETTLLDALSLAGFQEFAKKDKITVRRGNKIVVTFNFKKAASKGEGLDKNITLEDGDFVYVPGD